MKKIRKIRILDLWSKLDDFTQFITPAYDDFEKRIYIKQFSIFIWRKNGVLNVGTRNSIPCTK